MRKLHGLAMASFLCLVAMPAFAQKITGTIRGHGHRPHRRGDRGGQGHGDERGHRVSRAACTTTSAGIYAFAELPVGSYRVQVEHPGFKSEVRSKVVAERGRRARGRHRSSQTGDVSEVVDVEVRGGRGEDRSAPTSRAWSPGRRRARCR